jgi:oleate hydratase
VAEDFFRSFRSNFWMYRPTMFATVPCPGALEMKLYVNRFVHHFGGFTDLSTIKWTRYVAWLEQHGVTVEYDTRVTNVVFEQHPEAQGRAAGSNGLRGGKRGGVDLSDNDLVLITIGSPVENSSWDHNTLSAFDTEIREGGVRARSPWRCCSACSTWSTGPGRSCRASNCARPELPCVPCFG